MLIFRGFITSLLDDIHVILGHIPYPPGSLGICLFVHTVIIERMSLVMAFLGFHHVLIDATIGHIPYLPGSFGGGQFVQTFLIEDMSHCYDIFGLHHIYVGCHTRAYPSNFAFTIFSSNVQTSSSAYQVAFIWIRCLDFICITFDSTVVRRSDFIFCILGVQTLPSYGLDVQTSSVSYFLAP